MNNGDDGKKVDLTRRKVLAGFAASAGAIGLGACGSSEDLASSGGLSGRSSESSIPAMQVLPDPNASGIDHIVVVMMENRSFDHYLGWVPGANGVQAGLTFYDKAGVAHSSYDLAPNYQNCECVDPDHSYDGGRIQLNGGNVDGFLLTQPVGDQFPIGYYTASSVPFLKGVVDHWTICDRYHCGLLGPTWPNRLYMHAGQTDRITNSLTPAWSQSTVWDQLKSVGKTGRYYYGDIAGWALVSFILAGHNPGLSGIQPFSQFLSDAKNGKLADVSFVDPSMLGEGAGTSNDDHPLADIRKGQAFLNSVYNAVRTSPQWEKTLLIINYDEWGGFFDHVVPPYAPVGYAEFKATGNDGRLGFRVPCMAIGPRARRGYIEKRQLDPNSILNMIAWRFGFSPLGARASSLNFAQVLDFASEPKLDAPAFSVPDDASFGQSCSSQLKAAQAKMSPERYEAVMRSHAEHLQDWDDLINAARDAGLTPPQ